MSEIALDPAELAALGVAWRNASYDVAGIATECRARAAALAAAYGPAGDLAADVDAAVAVLHAAAAALDDDSLLLSAIGHRAEEADSMATAFGVAAHPLLDRLRTEPPDS